MRRKVIAPTVAEGISQDGASTRIRVIGRASSINVRKVLWTCEELDLKYVHELGPRPDAPAMLALSPNGEMPVLRIDDFTLWGTNTICRFLARRQARDDLLPADPLRCACVEQWIDWASTTLDPVSRYAFRALVRKDPLYRDPAATRRSAVGWNASMVLLDKRLAQTQSFVAGTQFTLADVAVGFAVQRWRSSPLNGPRLEAVERYFAALRDRRPFRIHSDSGCA